MNNVSLYTLSKLLSHQQVMEHFLYSIGENVAHLSAPPLLTPPTNHCINVPDIVAFSEKEVWLVMLGQFLDVAHLPWEIMAVAAEYIGEHGTVNVVAIVNDVPWDVKKSYYYAPLAPHGVAFSSIPEQGVHAHVLMLPAKHQNLQRNALPEMQQLLDVLGGRSVKKKKALPLLKFLRDIPYTQHWSDGVRYMFKCKHSATYSKYAAHPYPDIRAFVSASTFVESYEKECVRTLNSAAPVLAEQGVSATQIARQFSVEPEVVERVLAGEPWESNVFVSNIPKVESLPLLDAPH